MGTRTMKQDIFTIKAIESKGYVLEELITRSDEEIEKLPLSAKLITFIQELKTRGGKTADQLAEQIADLMMREEKEPAPAVVEAYADVSEEVEELPTITMLVDDETEIVVQGGEVTIEAETIVVETKEVPVERTEAAPDDIAVIREALAAKEAKSFQPFIKHLKAAVPASILDAVDSTVVSDLIDARIAEVKAAAEKK